MDSFITNALVKKLEEIKINQSQINLTRELNEPEDDSQNYYNIMIDDDQSNKNLEADLADLVEECRSYHSDEIEEDRDDDNAIDFYDLNS